MPIMRKMNLIYVHFWTYLGPWGPETSLPKKSGMFRKTDNRSTKPVLK